MSATRALRSIEQKYSTPEKLKWASNLYNTKLKLTGHNAPQQKAAATQIESFLSNPDFSHSDIWNFWEQIWTVCTSIEEKNLALHFWTHPKNYALAKRKYRKLLAWAQNIENWLHSDYLSSLYVKFYEDPEIHKSVDEVFEKWNRSKNPWLVRQSMVSIYYYSSQRKNPAPATLVLKRILPHLSHQHHYVQKGIGWTLRETYQVDKKTTEKFIFRNLSQIDPKAYSAAIEKHPKNEKLKLHELRKKLRKQARQNL